MCSIVFFTRSTSERLIGHEDGDTDAGASCHGARPLANGAAALLGHAFGGGVAGHLVHTPATFHGTGLEHFHSVQCLKRDQFFYRVPSAHGAIGASRMFSGSPSPGHRRPSPAPADRPPRPYIAFAHLGVVTWPSQHRTHGRTSLRIPSARVCQRGVMRRSRPCTHKLVMSAWPRTAAQKHHANIDALGQKQQNATASVWPPLLGHRGLPGT
jgi:hypothetical protein